MGRGGDPLRLHHSRAESMSDGLGARQLLLRLLHAGHRGFALRPNSLEALLIKKGVAVLGAQNWFRGARRRGSIRLHEPLELRGQKPPKGIGGES